MRVFEPLRNKPLARLWAALSLSAVGDQLQRMAVIWLAVELAGAGVGFVASAESAAVLLVALFAGAWTERWDHRRAMIGADLVRAGLALAPVAAALAGRLDIWTLVIPSVALAGLRGVFDPALQASLPRLAPTPRRLIGANALMDATNRIARLVGPALAGALTALLPTVGLLAVNAGTFLVSGAVVAGLRRELPYQTHDGGRSRLQLLLRGFGAVRTRPQFVFLLALGGVVAGLWMVALWVCVPLVVQARHLSAFGAQGLGVVGLVMGAYGAGNLASNLVVGGLEIRRPVRLFLAGNATVGAGIALMALALAAPAPAVVPLMMAAAAFAATGGPMSDVPLALLRQTTFAQSDVAAVYRLYIVADWGGMTLATAVAPFVLRDVSPGLLMLACGLAIVGLSASGFLRAEEHAPVTAE